MSHVKINNPENIPEEIVAAAIEMVEKEEGRKVIELTIRTAPEEGTNAYDITPVFEPVSFQRIRRITGYLVGSLDRFNAGKRAEVEDRVKMSIMLKTIVYDMRWNYNHWVVKICLKLIDIYSSMVHKHISKQKELTSNYKKNMGLV